MRARVLAESDDASDARLGRAPFQPGEIGIVAVDEGRALRLDAEEYFRLGVGDSGEPVEELEMHRLDRGHDRHMRPHQARQGRDLAGMVHADLEHAIARRLGHAGKRQRHAPMIVERGGGGMRLAVGAQREPQRLLGRRLAHRTGDGGDLGVRAGAGGAGKIAHPLQHIGNDEERRFGGEHCAFFGSDHREPRPFVERGRDEVVRVVAFAGDGEERFARPDRPAVDRDAGHARRQRARSFGPHRLRHAVDRPQRRIHALFSRKAAAMAS